MPGIRKFLPLAIRWVITCKHLQAGFEAIHAQQESETVNRCLSEYADFLAHNELECALDMLECACESFAPSSNTWHLLAKAAESMDLHERASALLRMAQNGPTAEQSP